MTILSVRRDGMYPAGTVGMTCNDTLSTVQTTGYLAAQAVAISNVNNGAFVFDPTDAVHISCSNGQGIFGLSANFSSLVALTV